jgi:chromosome segregation ATPase
MTSVLPSDYLTEDGLTRYRREHREEEERLARERRQEARERQRTRQAVSAPDDYWAEVDARIARQVAVILETVSQALDQLVDKLHASVRQGFDKRDRAIAGLERQIKLLRDEIGLERSLANFKVEVEQARQQARDRELENLQRELATLRDEVELKLNLKSELAAARSELAAARSEIEELRQRAPNFESALAELREQNARQEKVIRRLRGEQSTLEYQQRQLAAEQQKDRREVSLTAVRMTAFGQQTEKILRELYESGFNVVDEMPQAG